VVPTVGIVATAHSATGRGVEIQVGDAERLWTDPPPPWRGLVADLREVPGARTIAVEVDGELVAAAVVDERLRSSWPEALAALDGLGVAHVVMTGDSAERARSTTAGMVMSGMTPEEKLEEVRGLQEGGSRLMYVGDGVNDAAAMAVCEVSVAVGGGADLAVDLADATWFGGDLRVIPEALELARRTVRTIRSNLLLAAAYNAIGMSLAAGGVLHPVAAVVLMTCSSLVVTWRSIAVLQEEGEAPAAADRTLSPEPGRA
jgi:P-type E1-E2 ATPase